MHLVAATDADALGQARRLAVLLGQQETVDVDMVIGPRGVSLAGGHDFLAVGGWELGRGLGGVASGVPATAQCR